MPNKILVAVSGGPDSVSLLFFLIKQGYEIIAAHLNHKIRGKDSDSDEIFVKNLCKKQKIPLFIERIDVPAFASRQKLSIEDAARKCRYDFLSRIAHKSGAGTIALGHNADDNVETFLMNLMRGAGLKGLSGIPPLRKILKSQILIIRPMLKIWRKEIIEYCKKHKLRYRIDKSNFDAKYFRNKIRYEVIPAMEKLNPNFKLMISNIIERVGEECEFVERVAESELKNIQINSFPDSIFLDIKQLRQLPEVIRSYVLRTAIENVKGNLVDIEFVHIQNIMDQIHKTEGWKINLPDGIIVSGDRNKLIISKNDIEDSIVFNYKLKVPGITNIPAIGIKITSKIPNPKSQIPNKFQIPISKYPNTICLDLDKTGKELYVRNWKAGDRFQPFGMKGTKKLSDYFVDIKISLGEKRRIPVIVNNKNQIVCVNKRIDERFKVDSSTKAVLNLL